MNEEEKSKVLQAIKDRYDGAPVCPLCKHEEWALCDEIVLHPMQPNPPDFQVGGSSLPCIVLICNTCGNTHFLNALVLGLKEVTEKKKKEPEIKEAAK